MTYPTASDLKTFLSASGSAEDTLLGWINDGAIAFVERYTGRDFVADTLQTRYVLPDYPNLVGKRKLKLLLRGLDLVAVTTVTNGDGVVVAATDYTLWPLDGPPYWAVELHPDAGLRWWRGSDGAGNVKVEGTVGNSASCPKDIFLAILEISAHLYRGRLSGGVGQKMYTSKQGLLIEPAEIPPEVMQVLDLHRRF